MSIIEAWYLSPDDDQTQDKTISSFRDFVRNQVSKPAGALEIGPSYNPILAKKNGYNVTVLDHEDQGSLIQKYSQSPVNITNIEAVDLVWRAGPLSSVLDGRQFDAIVAAHVIEHAPDFVQFLNDCSAALRDDGRLFLLVPDKRYCFDYFQPLTDIAKVLSDHLQRQTRHPFASFYRWGSIVSHQNRGDWGQHPVNEITFIHRDSRQNYSNAVRDAESEVYVDAHENFFTPLSFLMLAEELFYLGEIDLYANVLTRSRGCEFLVVLSKHEARRTLDEFLHLKRRLYALRMIEDLEAIRFADWHLEHQPLRQAAAWVEQTRAIPIKIINEATLPTYRSPAKLCGSLARRGRSELIPPTSRRVSEWSSSPFSKAGHPIPEWWQDDPVVPGRAVEMIRLSNAYYFPDTGSIVSADGEAMESAIEEFRACTRDHSLASLPGMTITGGSVSFNPSAFLPQLKRAIVTMPAGATGNYAHFILDCLSGVVATMGVPYLLGYPYVFPSLTPWQRRHLELVGIKSPVVTAKPIYRVSRLFFTNSMAHNLHWPNVHFLTLRDIQLSSVSSGVPSSAGDRIYISRKNAQRSFLNEPELETRLAALGFSIVQPEIYNVDQQIQMFCRAKVVVGPLGAAFANVLYCRPGTLVIGIVPTPMNAQWVGWLCALTNSRWRPYFCEGRSDRAWAVLHDLIYSADTDQLMCHILNEIAD